MKSRAVWPLFCAASFVAVPGSIQVASAQVSKAWVATHDDGNPVALALDGDGNVVVTGFARSPAMEFEIATVKYSSDGTQLWDRRCGGEIPWGLAIDSAGNVLVAGRVAGDPDIDYVTVKYSPDGTELWVRRYDGPGHIDDFPTGIAVDGSGNALVTGLSLPPPGSGPAELATVKYDPDGREVWVRRYPGAGDVTDQRRWLAVDGAGNVYVAGTFVGDDVTSLDYLTVKYAPDGTELWARRFNGPDSLHDELLAVAADAAGNVYATGGTLSSGDDWDFATVKYASDGTELWARRWDGPASGVDRASGIAVGAEGDVHVTGGSQGADGRSGWVTIKYDRDGNELWVERHGGQDFYSPPAAMVLDGAGNVFVAGDLVQLGSNDIVKYDPSGKVLWVKQQPVTIAAIAVAPEGSVYSTGRMEYGGQDYVTIKYQPPPLRRGYVDEDGDASITDAIAVLTYLFLGEDELECLDAADIDDSGDINISDPIRLLMHLFVGGPAPAEPFSECGRDITPDSIECTASEVCSPFRDLPSMDFYGQEFQTDGVTYVVDRSPNMMETGELSVAKREILRTIGGFPETVEFGIIFFDSGVAQFPPGGAPAKADAEAKLAATSFVESIDWGQGSCCHVGLLAGLECANQSEAQRKVLIYVGNGGGTCTGSDEPEYLEETLAAVTSLNTHGVEIHCIGIVSPSTQGRHFMHRLAWDNGGSYTEIVR